MTSLVFPLLLSLTSKTPTLCSQAAATWAVLPMTDLELFPAIAQAFSPILPLRSPQDLANNYLFIAHLFMEYLPH